MAKKIKNALNEDVDLLNDEDKVSETPATLVSPSPDREYNIDGAELSPNPTGFGFTSQIIVDSLPNSGNYNVLYIVPIKNNGNIVGYKKWRWDVESKTYKRVYGSIPNLSLNDGGRQTPTNVVNPQRAEVKTFNQNVNINGLLKVNGKTITGEIPESLKLYKHNFVEYDIGICGICYSINPNPYETYQDLFLDYRNENIINIKLGFGYEYLVSRIKSNTQNDIVSIEFDYIEYHEGGSALSTKQEGGQDTPLTDVVTEL